ncbi:MAG: hypothetical protein DCC65_10125 [Planctomycetota bacterium]|nr:MAG: hypothetical protein DCC65_10125 [Planctomycetota bacterium]
MSREAAGRFIAGRTRKLQADRLVAAATHPRARLRLRRRPRLQRRLIRLRADLKVIAALRANDCDSLRIGRQAGLFRRLPRENGNPRDDRNRRNNYAELDFVAA